MKVQLGLALLASVFALSACVPDIQTVEGSIERIGVQGTGFSQVETRFVKLVGDQNIYECFVRELPECAVLEPGDKITMEVGYGESYNEVYNIEFYGDVVDIIEIN